MKLYYPPRSDWKSVKAKLENKLADFKREPDLRMFLTDHPWILSLAFGSGEGAVFSEYRVGPDEITDYLIVNGRSLHLQVTLVELKRPDDRILNLDGEWSEAFKIAHRQMVSRMGIIDDDRQGFLTQLKEFLVMTGDEKSSSPFQGAIHNNFFHVLRFNELRKFTLTSKIIIGRRKDETLAVAKYRNAVLDHCFEVMPYDRLLDLLTDPPNLIEPEWDWR